MNVRHYLNDGACFQSKAVLSHLQEKFSCPEIIDFCPSANIARYDDGRRHGYVLWANFSPDLKEQINFAFFNDENNDDVKVYFWIGEITLNHPTPKDLPKVQSKITEYVESNTNAYQMANWIFQKYLNYMQNCRENRASNNPNQD